MFSRRKEHRGMSAIAVSQTSRAETRPVETRNIIC
jgi:hypothetical protein